MAENENVQLNIGKKETKLFLESKANTMETKDPLPECPEYFENSNEYDLLLDTPPQVNVMTRAVFKKSHTCGSLFAKCSCNNENQINNNNNNKSLQYSNTYLQNINTRIKRSSSPAILVKYNNSSRIRNKRYSNPDVSVSNEKYVNIKDSSDSSQLNSKTVIKQVYLNHPEINFPITVEIQRKDSQKNCDIIVPNRINNNNVNSNLDYHKYTALAYESHSKNHINNDNKDKEEEANKFLKDFGIFGPMGNGASAVKSSNDADVLDRIRKSSKIMCIDNKKNHHLPEDYEYLKSLAPRLEKELSELELKYGTIETELTNTKKELSFKDNQIVRLQREIHKLKVSIFRNVRMCGNVVFCTY